MTTSQTAAARRVTYQLETLYFGYFALRRYLEDCTFRACDGVQQFPVPGEPDAPPAALGAHLRSDRAAPLPGDRPADLISP